MAGSIITLADGSTKTARFRRKFSNETKAVYYSSNVYNDLMAQDGCVGIRIYNAIDEDGNLTNVLVGVDTNGDDMYTGTLINYGAICPPICPPKNPLNS